MRYLIKYARKKKKSIIHIIKKIKINKLKAEYKPNNRTTLLPIVHLIGCEGAKLFFPKDFLLTSFVIN